MTGPAVCSSPLRDDGQTQTRERNWQTEPANGKFKRLKMSNHFTGLSLGPPLGDQRLDLCDLYAFQSPTDPARTAIILNANPTADALHPDAIYRVNIDNDGDCLTDIAFSYVFSQPRDGKQTVNVFVAKGVESRSVEAVGTKIIADAEVSFGPKPNIVKSGGYTFFAGSRSDAFFFDFDGIKSLFDTKGGRNFTAPHLGGKAPWTGVDSNTQANVFSTAIAVENTLACVFESTPVHGALPPRCGAVKFLPPLVSNRLLIPSKSKKNASLRLPAKKV